MLRQGRGAHRWMKPSIQFFMRLSSASKKPCPSDTGFTLNMLSHSSLRIPALAAWYENAYGGISPIAVPVPHSSAAGSTCNRSDRALASASLTFPRRMHSHALQHLHHHCRIQSTCYCFVQISWSGTWRGLHHSRPGASANVRDDSCTS